MGTLVFLPSEKPTAFSKFQFDLNEGPAPLARTTAKNGAVIARHFSFEMINF